MPATIPKTEVADQLARVVAGPPDLGPATIRIIQEITHAKSTINALPVLPRPVRMNLMTSVSNSGVIVIDNTRKRGERFPPTQNDIAASAAKSTTPSARAVVSTPATSERTEWLLPRGSALLPPSRMRAGSPSTACPRPMARIPAEMATKSAPKPAGVLVRAAIMSNAKFWALLRN